MIIKKKKKKPQIKIYKVTFYAIRIIITAKTNPQSCRGVRNIVIIYFMAL